MKILIAERDDSLRDWFSRYFRNNGHETETAANGVECFAKLNNGGHSLLILDQHLLWGGADGVLTRMRQDESVPTVPVILLIGDGTDTRLRRLCQRPVLATLNKPFRMHELLRYVNSIEDAADEGNSPDSGTSFLS